MSFPPTYDFPENTTVGDDVIFTDIPVDPTSFPVPAPEPIVVSDDSGEEDSEEDPMEDEEDSSWEEDESPETIPFYYTPGGGMPCTTCTARRSVHFPSTNYTSDLSGIRHSRTPAPTVPPPLTVAQLLEHASVIDLQIMHLEDDVVWKYNLGSSVNFTADDNITSMLSMILSKF